MSSSMEKTCPICNKEHPITMFNLRRSDIPGYYQSHCRNCNAKLVKKYKRRKFLEKFSVESLTLLQALHILELNNFASKEEYKKRFKKKCFDTHPDVGGDPKEFVLIQHAFKILMENG